MRMIVFVLQSYILSTTTETFAFGLHKPDGWKSFNRTSFQQQLKPFNHEVFYACWFSFNRTSFQQQLKLVRGKKETQEFVKLQSYILSTTTETKLAEIGYRGESMLQSYILSTTTETSIEGMTLGDIEELQSYILSTTTETISP